MTTPTYIAHCPHCGAQMDQIRKGDALRQEGPAYICPNDRAETYTDEHGHDHRLPPDQRRHGPHLRVWIPAPEELAQD